jgi:thioredoxin-related protein
MKGTVIALPSVQKKLESLLFAELYTDRDSEEDIQNNKDLKNVFKTVALPLYVVVDQDGKELSRLEGTASEAEFLEFLDRGLQGLSH